jgi:hypothetical protein
MGLVQDEATRVGATSAQERRGVITSIIANINGLEAKMMTTGMVAIGWDAIAVVSTRGAVSGYCSITSGAGKGPAAAKDAHCLRLGIINDEDDRCSRCHPPPLCRVNCHPRPHALTADVNIVATVQDDVPLYHGNHVN